VHPNHCFSLYTASSKHSQNSSCCNRSVGTCCSASTHIAANSPSHLTHAWTTHAANTMLSVDTLRMRRTRAKVPETSDTRIHVEAAVPSCVWNAAAAPFRCRLVSSRTYTRVVASHILPRVDLRAAIGARNKQNPWCSLWSRIRTSARVLGCGGSSSSC